MHEWSICRQLVKAVEEARRDGAGGAAALDGVRVAVGGLHQIVPAYMEQAWGVMTRGTELEGVQLTLRPVPIRARCGDCGAVTEIDPPRFSCGECGSFTIETTQGDELALEALEVAENECAGN